MFNWIKVLCNYFFKAVWPNNVAEIGTEKGLLQMYSFFCCLFFVCFLQRDLWSSLASYYCINGQLPFKLKENVIMRRHVSAVNTSLDPLVEGQTRALLFLDSIFSLNSNFKPQPLNWLWSLFLRSALLFYFFEDYLFVRFDLTL